MSTSNNTRDTSTRDLNKVILVGEVSSVGHPNGAEDGAVVWLRTSVTLSGDPGEGSTYQWHRLVCQGNLADFVTDYVRTGDRIYVEGSLAYCQHATSEIHYTMCDIHARDIVMLRRASDRKPSRVKITWVAENVEEMALSVSSLLDEGSDGVCLADAKIRQLPDGRIEYVFEADRDLALKMGWVEADA